MRRTRAQRRWMRQGFVGEATYRDGHGKPWNFILVLKPESYAYFRKHQLENDWIRPICPVFIHNGRKPR